MVREGDLSLDLSVMALVTGVEEQTVDMGNRQGTQICGEEIHG
jgi:hypothetical protein